MLPHLLDTNLVVYLIKRRSRKGLGRFDAIATRMAISVITLAERLRVAAHAHSEGLVLVTNNEAEFRRVPTLQIESWL